ncbi:hypothetical protein D3C80_982160 [compost metagenome]
MITQAVVVVAEQAWFDATQGRIKVGIAAEQLGCAATVFRALLDESAGGQDRLDQRPGRIGVLFDKDAGATQDFLRMIRPDRLAGGECEAMALRDGIRGPGFADTKTVDAPGLQVSEHLCGRHHHAVDVMQGVDALAGEPVIQPHGVSARRKGLGKGQFCPALVHIALQRLGTGHALTL